MSGRIRHHLWVTLSEQLLVGHEQSQASQAQAWKLAGKMLLPRQGRVVSQKCCGLCSRDSAERGSCVSFACPLEIKLVMATLHL